MSDDRENVFAAVRAALAKRPDRTPRPELDPASLVVAKRLEGRDSWDAFARNFTGVRGFYHASVDQLVSFLEEKEMRRGYCDPALAEDLRDRLRERFELVEEYSREAVDTVDFSLTVGSAVIAETGTIILRDTDTSNRQAALAPWIHVAVVHPERIYRTLGEALEALGEDPSTIFVTGPSKTADVEGILIEGVHGPGEQVCLCYPAPEAG